MTAPTARPAAPPTGKPILLDAYCGAGGSARGYQLAGFYVVGVDVAPQPRYAGDELHRGDAIEFIRRHGREFDAIHASPPCQAYSRMRHLPWLRDREYPLLIEPTIATLRAIGRPWVLENVEDAPLPSAIILCGTMFGLPTYRHRKFESSVRLLAPPHHKHTVVIGSGRNFNDRRKGNAAGFVTVAGNNTGKAVAARALGIDWMSRAELGQAIPPDYCEFVGRQLLRALGVAP
jgi:DNA (cytosine-5)-methyltransferase 1